MNFWQKLKKPFTVLAPMEDVTDTVFRQMVASVGRPDIFFTEFTNVEGIVSTSLSNPPPILGGGCKGVVHPVLQRFVYSKSEHPIVAQIWGKEPENFYTVAKLIKKLGFDGVDINMGCPQKDVVKNGCSIALIRDRDRAREIIQATREGADGLPVSVKTRIGLDKIVTEDWCGFLLEQKLDALTVHGRTAKEMSDVPAHWDEIAKVVSLRNQSKSRIIIIGNGDVRNAQNAMLNAQEYGVDGIMIGRGVFENINCFNAQNAHQRGGQAMLNTQEKIDLLKKHLKLWEKTWGNTRNFAIMKKFFKIYIRDFEGAGELRGRLMQTADAEGARFELARDLHP